MTAIEILSNGTTKAVWLILTATKKVDPNTVDCGVLAETIKSVLKDNISTIMAEWKDATETHRGGIVAGAGERSVQ